LVNYFICSSNGDFPKNLQTGEEQEELVTENNAIMMYNPLLEN
jgi:hypothetical protein